MTPEPEPLDSLLEPLESDQDDLLRQARESLEQTLAGLNLTPAEEQALAGELGQLRDLAAKLDATRIEIAAFGMVSRGKSSVLNALAGKDLFRTGVTHGTTTTRGEHPWDTATVSSPALDGVQLVLVDTPGIDEVGGEIREAMAQTIARHADLILFIVSGDMQRREFEALSELRAANKPILLVFNQIDRYPDADRDAIRAKIQDERVRSLIRPDDIILTAARPDPFRVKIRHPDGSTTIEWERPEPIIEPLKVRILEVLEREGKALVALNALLFAGDLHREIVAHKVRIRDEAASRLIWNYALAKGVAVALNPIPVADMAGGLAVDIAMVVALSRLYGLPLTKKSADRAGPPDGRGAGRPGRGRGRHPALRQRGEIAPGGRLGRQRRPVPARLRRDGIGPRRQRRVHVLCVGSGREDLPPAGLPVGPRGIKTVLHQILEEAKADSVLDRLKDELKQKVKVS